jgi:hypothetical protein
VFRAGFGHAPPGGYAAGEEEFVGLGVDEGLAEVAGALNDGDQMVWEACV